MKNLNFNSSRMFSLSNLSVRISYNVVKTKQKLGKCPSENISEIEAKNNFTSVMRTLKWGVVYLLEKINSNLAPPNIH